MDVILMVPIHPDALHLATERSVLEARADFRRLSLFDGEQDVNPDVANLSQEILSQPFQDRVLDLKAGIHLHGSLPDALTRGVSSGDGSVPNFRPRKAPGISKIPGVFLNSGTDPGGGIMFPAVPNRWLVTRTHGASVNQRVVESDYLAMPIGVLQPSTSISST